MPIRNIGVVLLAWLALPVFVCAEGAPSEYATLLASLKAGNTAIDYTRLRLSYMDSPERKKAIPAYGTEKAMKAALDAKDFPKALKEAETILDLQYVSMDAHFVAFVANREMGAAEKADFHRTVFRGLLDSVRNSGDGKSTATAWVVISVREEYVLLSALGFQPSGQSLLNEKGHAYDVMKVKSREDGSEQTFYFNVDIPMKDGI